MKIKVRTGDNSSSETGARSRSMTESSNRRENASGESHGASHEDELSVSQAQHAEPTSEEEINQELVDRLRVEAEATYDKYLRSVAELENFKKRTAKERSDLIRYAGEGLARDLLEVLDSLRIALAQDLSGVSPEFVNGIQLVQNKFESIFERHGIKGQPAQGKPFDPQTHEAVATVPTSEHPEGMVLEEYKRAYFFKDKLIRPGQVIVSKKGEETPPENEN